MQLSHFYHRHHLHRLAGHSNFRFFELAIWLHTFAQSLAWVFVPILLLQIGYSITDILIYSLVLNAVDVPLNFVAANLIYRLGARMVLIMGIAALIIFFAFLNILIANNWPLLILLAILVAVYDTLFWVSQYYIFIEINKEKGLDPGNTTGAIEAVRKIATIAGPIVGALLLILLGKSSLLFAGIFFNIAAILMLYKMRHLADVPTEPRPSVRKFFSGLKEKKNYLSVAFWGIHGEVDAVLWPIFIFTLFGSIGSVAALPVIVSFTTAVFSFVAGKLTKKHSFTMIAVGSLAISLTWALRIVFEHNIFYYVTVFLIGFFSLLVSIPIDAEIVKSGLKKGSLAASTYRNTVSMFARVPLYLILLLLLEVFKVSFGLAALSLFVVFFLTLILNRPTKKS